MIVLQESERGVSFSVRVQPRARRAGIQGTAGNGDACALKISLSAPPVDGRANEELIERLADLLEVPRSAVDVIAGAQSRNKVIQVQGRTLDEVRRLLAEAP